jgi:hypothetical protein
VKLTPRPHVRPRSVAIDGPHLVALRPQPADDRFAPNARSDDLAIRVGTPVSQEFVQRKITMNDTIPDCVRRPFARRTKRRRGVSCVHWQTVCLIASSSSAQTGWRRSARHRLSHETIAPARIRSPASILIIVEFSKDRAKTLSPGGPRF